MTFEELQNAEFVPNHQCSCCEAWVGYLIHPEMAAAVFQHGCGCTETFPNYRLLTHGELAEIPSSDGETPNDKQ